MLGDCQCFYICQQWLAGFNSRPKIGLDSALEIYHAGDFSSVKNPSLLWKKVLLLCFRSWALFRELKHCFKLIFSLTLGGPWSYLADQAEPNFSTSSYQGLCSISPLYEKSPNHLWRSHRISVIQVFFTLTYSPVCRGGCWHINSLDPYLPTKDNVILICQHSFCFIYPGLSFPSSLRGWECRVILPKGWPCKGCGERAICAHV